MGKSTIIFGIRNPFKNGYIPYTYSELLIQGLLRYTLMVYKKITDNNHVSSNSRNFGNAANLLI
ncbi:hypothetical protein SGP15004_41370 [Shigella flexneri]|nr:hypothetical protein BS654_01980 [Shigella flexneri 4c]ASQ60618.1 hypothetical protein BS647_00460 [Shigella flexneri 1a]AUU32844.1 hypothetical protein MC63_020725 [Shigella flexneri]AXC57665.1 hypothetical protein B5690_15635 [Shigella flexneri 2a]OUZ55906.1 hypothetical protein CBL27_23900 [Shigella sonnei]